MEKTMDNAEFIARMIRLHDANTFEEAVGKKSVTHFWEMLMRAEVGGTHIFTIRLWTCFNLAKGNGLQWLAELMEICDNRWWVNILIDDEYYAEMYNVCYGKIAEYVATLSEEEQEEFYNY